MGIDGDKSSSTGSWTIGCLLPHQGHHIDLLIIIVAAMIVGHCYMPGRVLRIFTPCNYPRSGLISVS